MASEDGRERYFWSLLAAVGIFVGGGVFAAHDGWSATSSPPIRWCGTSSST